MNSNKITDVTLVVLTGGESRRMGTDKSHVVFEGKPLVEHVLDELAPLFEEVLISAHDDNYDLPSVYSGLPVITDDTLERGPAIGLRSALKHASNDYVFLISCDVPFVRSPLVRRLVELKDDFDSVAPVARGRVQTTFALYSKKCLSVISRRIDEGRRGIVSLLKEEDSLNVRFVEEEELREADPGLKSFFDIDTPEELAELASTKSGKETLP